LSFPLAVFTPEIGVPHATFIRRHVQDLLPGRTAVMASPSLPAWQQPDWSVEGPLLDIDRVLGRGVKWRLVHRATNRVGVKLDRLMIQRFLRAHGVRVVMGEFLDFSVEWLDAVRGAGVPFFAHAHGADVSGPLLKPEWRSAYLKYRDAAGIITVSRASRDELVALGLRGERVHVIPCGVDVPASPIARTENAEIRCMAVGMVVSHKAPILLLDAFRRAALECPRLHLDYIGGGPLLPAARDFVDAFHLRDRVTLHGAQPNRVVLESLARADIFLQHSRTDPETGFGEGMPVSILEAMAHALPVVSTRIGGTVEQIVEGSTGYLVEPGDTADMARHILRLANDAGLRHQLGAAGWRRAGDLYSWDKERTELLRVLGLDTAA
jgi:glycosyltransferase involved in cell wall biosynthesis